MRLATFDGGFGRIEGDKLIPMGSDLIEYLETGETAESPPIALEDVSLRAPVVRPGKILAVGPNYRAHASEAEQAVPESPDDLIVMAKFANSVSGPFDDVELPQGVSQVDYEAELGLIIGKTAREVAEDAALDHIAGYVCVNDLTDRHLQFHLKGLGGLTRSKAIDGFLPFGPWIVTPDELRDPQSLGIRCLVNDRVVQDATTKDMIFTVGEIVSSLSKTITLSPGDLISTGSPPGVGYGQDPQKFLKEGDTVTVEIGGIGSITNKLRKRPGSTRHGNLG